MSDDTTAKVGLGRPMMPSEVPAMKAVEIPGFVFDAFNRYIALNYVGTSASFKAADVWYSVCSAAEERGTTPNRDWLNVEDAYRAAGWKVVYDSPAYNESYDSTFTFTKK